MNRRHFIRLVGLWIAGTGLGPTAAAAWEKKGRAGGSRVAHQDRWIKDYLYKMAHFDEHHPQDVFVAPEDHGVFHTVRRRLLRVQRTVGHGNFHLLEFDEAVKIAAGYLRVGAFSRKEIDFLEALFYRDAAAYGFYGEKPVQRLTEGLQTKKAVKVRGTGNYLFAGRPREIYSRLRKTVGSEAILTSGIRSVIKQFLLFLNKVHDSGGNLSMASRSLAPPGYSFHSIGDFDVGQAGFGAANFTERFADTEVFRKLAAQGYVDLRYCRSNLLGVRFEPWHIQAAM